MNWAVTWTRRPLRTKGLGPGRQGPGYQEQSGKFCVGRWERPGLLVKEWEGPEKMSDVEVPRAKPMVPGPGRQADVAGENQLQPRG